MSIRYAYISALSEQHLSVRRQSGYACNCSRRQYKLCARGNGRRFGLYAGKTIVPPFNTKPVINRVEFSSLITRPVMNLPSTNSGNVKDCCAGNIHTQSVTCSPSSTTLSNCHNGNVKDCCVGCMCSNIHTQSVTCSPSSTTLSNYHNGEYTVAEQKCWQHLPKASPEEWPPLDSDGLKRHRGHATGWLARCHCYYHLQTHGHAQTGVLKRMRNLLIHIICCLKIGSMKQKAAL